MPRTKKDNTANVSNSNSANEDMTQQTNNATKKEPPKITLYLGDDLYTQIRTLARYKNVKVNTIITELVRQYVEKNRRRLEIFADAERQAAALDAAENDAPNLGQVEDNAPDDAQAQIDIPE